MAKHYSTALANFLAQGGGFADAMHNAKLKIFAGTIPVNGDAARAGTLLCTFTKGGAAYTNEVLATAVITLAGAAGSVDTLTVGGMKLIKSAVAFDTDLATTAANLAAAINAGKPVHRFTAAAAGAVVTITAPKNSGASVNGMTVAATVTTLTATINGGSSATLGGSGATAGVDCVNGLEFTAPVAGAVSKPVADEWRGTTLVDGTAAFFSLEGHGYDDGSDDATTKKYFRYQGSVGVAGADMNISSTTFKAGAIQTIGAFTHTTPTIQG